jgi:hypothetical protein
MHRFIGTPIPRRLIMLLLQHLPPPPGLGKKLCVDPYTGDWAVGVDVPPSGGSADTDCACAVAARPTNNPTLSTVDLSKLTMRRLRFVDCILLFARALELRGSTIVQCSNEKYSFIEETQRL